MPINMNKAIGGIIYIAIILWALSLFSLPVLAAPSLQGVIQYYDKPVPTGLEYIGGVVAAFDTDYWHYSGGYWLDGHMKENAISDMVDAFWRNPELYYDRPGMNIRAVGTLPDKVKEHIDAGGELVISVIPRRPDSINLVQRPAFEINGGKITISALPFFKTSFFTSYIEYVPALEKYIPIVSDRHGWNVYAIYKSGVHIGALGSSFAPNANAIEFTELLDTSGRIQSEKTFYVENAETGAITKAEAYAITIGDGTFNSAGGVGMWFHYDFDVKFYRYGAGDLEAIEIKSPNRTEGGKQAASVVRVRNNTQASYAGANAPVVRIWDGYKSYDAAVALGPGEEKDVQIQWTAPAVKSTVRITATINPDRAIDESDYRNNTASRDVIVSMPSASPAASQQPRRASPSPSPSSRQRQNTSASPQPAPRPSPRIPAPSAQPTPAQSAPPPTPSTPPPTDFAVTGFRETHYTALTVARSYVRVRHTGSVARSGIMLTFDDGLSTVSKSADFQPGEEKEIPVDWLTPQEPGTVLIQVEINPDRAVAEPDYSNNRCGYNVRIDEPPADLSVSAVIPSKYPAGKRVVTLVKVRNDGSREFSGANMAEVKITVPSAGFSSTKRISINKNSEIDTPFYWTAPASAGAFRIIAEVNPSRTIAETDYSNNACTLDAEAVDNPNPPPGCNNYRREWSEERFNGLVQRTIIAPDGAPRVVSEASYVTRDFYAEVSIRARLIPGEMKSGYGAECEVSASLSTNYDHPRDLIALQDVYAYVPTSGNNTAVKLEHVQGYTDRWRFPVNPASVTGARVQYVPVDWPDGKPFQITFTGRDAESPGGAMCATTHAQVMINGSMYEDDYTAPY